MRNLESLKLPRWIIKSTKPGEEDADFSSFVVGFLALYTVGTIAYFAVAPIGREHIVLDVIIALAILVVIVFTCRWLIAQAAYLKTKRKEAKVSFVNSKTEKEKEEAISRLKSLCVSLEQLEAI
jgi:cell division protein FtsL